MSVPSCLRASLALAVLALSVASASRASAGPRSESPTIEALGTLAAPILESSGVAVSRAHQGVLWTHNDSGGGPRLYAIAPSGKLLATFLVPGAGSEDWEDIALGECPSGGGSCLYIADTGDNLEKRREVAIYVLPEPSVTDEPMPGFQAGPQPHALRLRYPDGPHDVEAIALDPSGNLLLISKGRSPPARVYRVARAQLTGDQAVAEPVTALDVPTTVLLGGAVTGAATSPSKARLVVRTYTELYFYRFTPAGGIEPDGPSCRLGFAEPQGEGVDFLDEHTLVLTSESRGQKTAPILRVRCP